jgi:tRNA dimethylallyltransferase
MNKLLVIVGVTSAGKSDVAIKLAKKYNGEIISADSRQVYCNLDLGTGKVEKDKNCKDSFLSEGVVHYGLDIIDVKKQYSVSEFKNYCNKKIKEIWKKNKLPIICGGSPLYVISVLEGWEFPKTKPNLKLRKELEEKTTEELYLTLLKYDKERSKNIDSKNRRRLIRALEIVMKDNKIQKIVKKPIKADVLILGIKRDREEAKSLIWKRLNKRIKLGMIDEVKNLKENGVSSKRLDDLGLEYRYINMYLDKKISLKEMKEKLYTKICQFAKRQMTWFKKFENIIWVENNMKNINLKVKNWLDN